MGEQARPRAQPVVDRGQADAELMIDEIFRAEYGRAVSAFARVLGDLDLAEEVVQDAFATAAGQPPTTRHRRQQRHDRRPRPIRQLTATNHHREIPDTQINGLQDRL